MNRPLKSRRALFLEISEKDIERVLIESDDWVIVRVFEYDRVDDIFDVLAHYGKEKGRTALSRTHLKPVAAAVARLFLDLKVGERHAT